MTILIIIAGLLIIGALVYFNFKAKSQDSTDQFFISTQSQSKERIKGLNLDTPSEDASYILDKSKLNFPQRTYSDEDEYKANPEREWIISLIPRNGDPFHKKDFNEMFDYEWRSNFESTIYGFSPEEKRWTYANAGGTPDIYSKLQVAVNVQRVYADEEPQFSPEKLNRYLIELEKRIKQYPTPLKLEVNEPVEAAIAKAQKLVSLQNEFSFESIIVLQPKTRFKGMEVWDVLQSVGLEWGDMDLFHWDNDDSDFGGDHHFSVWTTTNPGYFFPEEIKNGRMKPENLVFGFSVPRSADPLNIQPIMIEAVNYCQKRLGGEMLDQHGNPYNAEAEIQQLTDFVNRMKAQGIVPGSENALRMF
ncbi:MAG: cell division protein ZipA C-terminal FtsZ-binding domain-containing protein [Bacteroidota bacterium]